MRDMADIFISYARADRERAKTLAQALAEPHGEATFPDGSHLPLFARGCGGRANVGAAVHRQRAAEDAPFPQREVRADRLGRPGIADPNAGDGDAAGLGERGPAAAGKL